ncbi:MAG: hypothetical protein ACKORF_01795 [Micrococcales bacterium]
MKQLKVLVLTPTLILSLTGCSLLYPNWGSTGLPTPTETVTQTQTGEPQPTQSETPTPTPTTVVKKSASVQILQVTPDATAGVIDVIAEVSNVSEDGGLCSLKITVGGVTKSQTVKAESNVSSTQCFPMELPLAGIPKGNANVTVTYESPAYIGSSAAQVVAIP